MVYFCLNHSEEQWGFEKEPWLPFQPLLFLKVCQAAFTGREGNQGLFHLLYKRLKIRVLL